LEAEPTKQGDGRDAEEEGHEAANLGHQLQAIRRPVLDHWAAGLISAVYYQVLYVYIIKFL
jgi:hypothetical protein